MAMNEKRAAILGGGIGGLTAATTLIRRGWAVEVYERAPSLPRTGTALGMWPAALNTLAECGLDRAVRERGALQDSGTLMSWDGRILGRITDLRRPAVLLSRPVLLELLAGDLPDGTVRFGTPAPAVSELDHDVVIAADGIGSAARDTLFGPRYRPVHTGYAAWRGSVPGATSSMSETWGPGALFGITPRDGDLTNWFAAVRAPEHSPGDVDVLRDRFGHWHPAVRDILDHLDPADMLYHDLYESPPLPSYVRDNTALIGDAAHAMAPNLGRGACEAMVDAAVLAALLSEHPVSDALRRYDRVRRRHTRRLVRASRLVAGVATSTRFESLRNTLLGAAFRLA